MPTPALLLGVVDVELEHEETWNARAAETIKTWKIVFIVSMHRPEHWMRARLGRLRSVSSHECYTGATPFPPLAKRNKGRQARELRNFTSKAFAIDAQAAELRGNGAKRHETLHE